MHPDPQQPQGAWDPRQPGPPSAYPPPGPGYIPLQQGYGGLPPYPVAPVPVGPGGQPLATFVDRLLAYLIDGLILGLVATVLTCPILIFAVVLPLVQADVENDTVSPAMVGVILLGYAAVFALQIVLSYVYFVEYQLRKGQTVGKRAMSIQILPATHGLAVDRGILVRRFLLQFGVGSIVPFFSLIDGLWQLWDQPRQQTLHDKAADTVVVKVVQ